jgi:hyperosmotically inducible periplasmic protein
MNRQRQPVSPLCAATAALLAAFTLTACDRNEDATVGQKVDTAIAETRAAGAQVSADVKAGAGEAKQAAKDAAADVGAGVKDAAITARLNTALAADSRLSALRIDVDTRDGRVSLSGTAPDAAARDHATTLATAVEGVLAVENRLSIGK